MAITQRRRRIPITIPVVSANWMKNAGIILMTIYFFGLAIVQNGLLRAQQYSSAEFSELVAGDEKAFFLTGLSSICYLIGVTAIPIFAFLLVQGIIHTKSVKKYLITVLIFAVISEIPYDLAVSGTPFNFEDQSVLFTALIALIALWLLKSFQGKGFVPVLVNLLIVGGGCFWAIVLNCKFGGGFVLLASIMFLFREKKGLSIVLGIIVCLIYATAPIGLVPVALYSGERKGTDKKSQKYFYYAYFPIMLALFAIWRILI